MANEYIIRTDMKVSGSALTVDGLTNLQDLTVNGIPEVQGGGPAPTAGTSQTPDTPIVTSGGDDFIYLSEPSQWVTVNIGGTDYVIPAYEV